MKNKERSSYTKFDIADFCPPLIFLAQSQLLRIKKLTLSCNQESHFYLALVKSGWKKIIQTLTLQWEASTEQRYAIELACICQTSGKVNLVERISDCTETMVSAVLKMDLSLIKNQKEDMQKF